MKKHFGLGFIVFISALLLAGCAPTRSPNLNGFYMQENWFRFVDTNPNRWAYGADRWFFTGNPSATEMAVKHAPMGAAVSTMAVKVPQFTRIRVEGNFDTQIYGTYQPNSVMIYGPNQNVRDVIVEVHGDTLVLKQARARQTVKGLIVRIGVSELHELTQLGCGKIEAAQIHSSALSVVSRGKGDIFLAGSGPLNVQRIFNAGSGRISVFGAKTRGLDITTCGNGSVNVSGSVSLRHVVHSGCNEINVIGANNYTVGDINASGAGKVGIYGQANFARIVARNRVNVYATIAHHAGLYVYAYDYARVGLAGNVSSVYVDTYAQSVFLGRNLCACNAYVRARGWSHVNIAASTKMFATATNNASVYFFGAPDLMSQFVSGNGLVMPVWGDGVSACAVTRVAPISYKGEVPVRNRDLVAISPQPAPFAEALHRRPQRPVQSIHEPLEVPFNQTRSTVAVMKSIQPAPVANAKV